MTIFDQSLTILVVVFVGPIFELCQGSFEVMCLLGGAVDSAWREFVELLAGDESGFLERSETLGQGAWI